MAGRHPRVLLNPKALTSVFLIFLALLQTGCSSVFFYPNNTTYITPDRLELDYENVFLNTPDGETLHGWWLPAKTDAPPKGTIYYLHGNAQNVSAHILNVAWLPPEGYNVFTLDYRGYGQSTGAPDIEGALHDVETGLRWLAEHHTDQPLFLLGQSLGGALGIALASEWIQRNEQPELKGVILDGTFSGFRYIAREKLNNFWLTWPFQYPLSWTIPDDYEGTDRIAGIAPVPVMIIHSIRDGIIPFHHGTRLYDAAEQPKEFLQTDTPHAATFVIPAYREAILEFMEK
ncbi:alpha/beta hydrolase [Marinobacter litoralis]|uniref:alpha/beta hydrolase n=1 Tax=Marinobacter litoralis TaxID=187981 RepID=UPI0018ED6B0B|nr:alpha/beta hydrolase [Marinobacter litoralis]MBJ6136867.1 alpha/beta hydrolase [Marinobacter litoralis]